jgi:molybdate transport system substrate-binding protein
MKRFLLLMFLAAALAFGWAQRRQAKSTGEVTPLTVFCAAGLKKPVDIIAEQCCEKTGQEVSLQFGGTGTLMSHLRIAKTGDFFLAADETAMADAAKLGLIRETFPLVVPHPVIAVAKSNPHQIKDLNDLLKSGIRLALADPEMASIGKVCKKLLGACWTALAAKAAVSKLTVTEIAADVKLGSADAALAWDHVIAQFPGIGVVETQELSVHKQRAMAAVLVFCKQPNSARRFADYLSAPAQGKVFTQHGFQPVVTSK